MSRTVQSRRARRIMAFALATTAFAASSGMLLPACGDGETTGGKRIVLKTRMVLAGDEVRGFTSGLGWQVALKKVLLGSGGLYYFDGVPPLARVEQPSFTRFARSFFEVRPAWAHPGHYQPGNALGQMTEPYTEDLMDGPVDLPDGEGVTGTYRSGRFSFAETAGGPGVDALEGHAAIVVGRAEKDGEEPREFIATADHAEIAKSQAKAEINGCVFEETDVENDGTVTVTVHPSEWFALVDFGAIEPGTEEAPSSVEADERASVAFSQGLAELSAYTFTYSR
jgi:hypothetical protein